MTEATRLEGRKLLVKIATLTAQAREDFPSLGADPILMNNLRQAQITIDAFKRLVSA